MTNNEIKLSNYTGITADSRLVKSGFIYVSIEGEKIDGDNFIENAIENGARLIVTRENSNFKANNVDVIKVKNPRSTLAQLAHEFYQPQPQNIVAVTGTSGKTSVAFFYKQITEFLGFNSASIGSLGVVSNSISVETEYDFATPDPITLNKMLKAMAEKGITHAIMEASSQGIWHNRIDGIAFKAAAFTNLSQDHLDYHGNMNDYFNAKLKLFTDVLNSGYAVLNADIQEFEKLKTAVENKPNIKILSYGSSGEHIKLLSAKKPAISLEILGEKFDTTYYPEGSFQIHNLMAAIGLALATGMKPHEIVGVIPKIKAAPGRLELISEYNGAKVFVDHAHKPDALEKALAALKSECKGKLFVIFGCGGDRDRTKRPIMGKIAASLADIVIVTDDNPRTEDPAAIRREVLAGCPGAREYDNRALAIADTIKTLNPSDMLLIAGKGHETYQIIGSEKIHFSDSEEVIKVISELD
jgi:UDP-N-acetylmuramoyl-L-alanyl-D-glutamate--2,6-diaminopimelate ligase